jgi:hypothetical protein
MATWSLVPCSHMLEHGYQVGSSYCSRSIFDTQIVLLGVALLGATRINAFADPCDGSKWAPKAWRFKHSLFVLRPLTLIFVIVNFFILGVYWYPYDPGKALKTTKPILPPYIGPAIGTMFYGLGVIYWLVDEKLLPYLGYTVVPAENRQGMVDVVKFNVILEPHLKKSAVTDSYSPSEPRSDLQVNSRNESRIYSRSLRTSGIAMMKSRFLIVGPDGP